MAGSPLACQINLLTTDWEIAPCELPAGDLSLAGAENIPAPPSPLITERPRDAERELRSKFARYFKISPYTGRGLGLEKNFVKIKQNKSVLLNKVSVLVNYPQRGLGSRIGFLVGRRGQPWRAVAQQGLQRSSKLNSVSLRWASSTEVIDCTGTGPRSQSKRLFPCQILTPSAVALRSFPGTQSHQPPWLPGEYPTLNSAPGRSDVTAHVIAHSFTSVLPPQQDQGWFYTLEKLSSDMAQVSRVQMLPYLGDTHTRSPLWDH